jgi:aspartyl-tRNA(Asn)/glutamyl-tRNA(Gln) amidotransferase subunit A
VSADRTVFRAEAYAYHYRHLAATPELYLPETRRKLELGAGIDAPSYIAARRDIAATRRRVAGLFDSVDVLVAPTAPVPAPRLADYPPSFDEVLALEGSAVLRNTRPFNAYGIPALTVPCGVTRAGLPVGLHIAGPPWQERRIFALARAYEAATDWHTRIPAVG